MTTGIDKKVRKLEGIVVSDKMDKTVVVKIDRQVKNAKYQKYFRISKRFKAHDEKNEYKVGDKVVIEETRPFQAKSKNRP